MTTPQSDNDDLPSGVNDRATITGVEIWGNRGVVIGDGNVVHNYVGASPQAVQWPLVLGRVPSTAGHFQDRELELPWGGVSDGEPWGNETLVLSGMGGVGKTHIAARYVEQLIRSGGLDLVLWVPASTREAIEAAYATAARVVGLAGADADAATAAHAFLGWLAGADRSWVVVLDDVATPRQIAGLWPPDVERGRTIVTTRYHGHTMTGRGRRLVKVGLFSPRQAIDCLEEQLADHPRLRVAMAEIARAVGYLPLALVHAAAYMINDDLPGDRYLELLSDRSTQLDRVFPKLEELGEPHQMTIAETWSLSMELAERLSPTLALGLLRLAALLSPHGIPSSVLTAEVVAQHFTSDADRSVATHDCRSALLVLHRLNLVTVDAELVRVHSLIQQVTRTECRRSLGTGESAALLRLASDALCEAWPQVDSASGVGAVLRANAAELEANAGRDVWTCNAYHALVRAADSLGEAGEIKPALARFTTMRVAAEKHLGVPHPDVAALGSKVAQYKAASGDLAGAITDAEETLRQLVNAGSETHESAVVLQANVAVWRSLLGDLAGATANMIDLLPQIRNLFGDDHPNTLMTRANLATWKAMAGDLTSGTSDLRTLVADSTAALGRDHPHTLEMRLKLGRWLGQAKNPDAVTTTTELVTELTRVLGPDHPNTLIARDNLAQATGHTGDAAVALEMSTATVEDMLRVLGPDNPITLQARNNQAHMLGDTGDHAGAAAAFEQLVADSTAILGATHPNTMKMRHGHASWLTEVGDYPSALRVAQDVLRDTSEVLGDGHPDIVFVRALVAGVLGKTGNLADAIAMYEELLRDHAMALNYSDIKCLTIRGNLAELKYRAGDVASAVQSLAELLLDHEHIYGPSHPATLLHRFALTKKHAELDDLDDPVSTYRELLGEYRRVLGPDEPMTITVHSELATCLGMSGALDEAILASREVLQASLRALGNKDPNTIAARKNFLFWSKLRDNTVRARD